MNSAFAGKNYCEASNVGYREFQAARANGAATDAQITAINNT